MSEPPGAPCAGVSRHGGARGKCGCGAPHATRPSVRKPLFSGLRQQTCLQRLRPRNSRCPCSLRDLACEATRFHGSAGSEVRRFPAFAHRSRRHAENRRHLRGVDLVRPPKASGGPAGGHRGRLETCWPRGRRQVLKSGLGAPSEPQDKASVFMTTMGLPHPRLTMKSQNNVCKM